MTHPHKGFTLLISVVLAAVALGIGLALLDISYKQVILAFSAKQSQYAFYAADAAMECALYYDQQQNAFAYANSSASISCNGQSITVTFTQSASPRTRTFSVPCAGGGTSAQVTIYKSSNAATQIFSDGYNICDANNTRRIERGLKVTY